MIFSKTALQAAVGILGKDSHSVLQFNTDGTILARNKKAIIVLDAARDDRVASLPLDKSPLPECVSVDAETGREILKNIPKDKLFNGLLECFSITKKTNAAGREEVIFRTTDGKRYRDIVLRGTWRKISLFEAKKLFGGGSAGVTACFNRKRLISLLQSIDKAFVDTANGYAPVWLSIRDDGSALVSTIDDKSKIVSQSVFALYQINEDEYKMPEIATWKKKKLLRRL